MAHPHPLASLPPGHFLALPPTFSNDPGTSITTASHAAPSAPNVASLAAADFDVDVRTGFLPPKANIERLPPPYDVWEDAFEAAHGDQPGDGVRLGGGRPKDEAWREGVRAMPVLDIAGLNDLPLLRRAHLVLAFLLHFYVHTTPTEGEKPTEVPACISVPILKISPLVGLPPVLTYADTVLWNVQGTDSSRLINLADNPPTRTLGTFTGTKSEAGFYTVSAECEAAGAAALALMRQCLDELFLADEVALRRLTVYLRQLAVQIDRVGDITLKMMTEVDPEEFYHLIRPWFRGGDGSGPDAPGWLFLGTSGDDSLGEAENMLSASTYTTEDGEEVRGRKFSGPSAGQSSVVHAFDVFLTVDHAPRADEDSESIAVAGGTESPRIILNSSPLVQHHHHDDEDDAPLATPTEQSGGPVEATFLQRMLQYMPLPHRTFLLHLAAHPTPLRPLVIARANTHPELAEAYNEALAALRRFRDKHMRVVSRHIVQQARRPPSERILKLLGREGEVAEKQEDVSDDQLRGTGGTPLIRFLKRCRDNVSRAMVKDA
ncbi:tryptophan 2,3-dioxygenase [Trichosporon asahii var. asahii CBS 2479]|uniref:Tryptophan 2,3-dioxygenase n=1 Tax=Trichosporon asahii var. asahii (strain ATCC 90039 / CBS 2479 / JCM 2466 / KCTC 7840 / NBRC 103889/ NCYC 2677 / UAMH 7654) TaxID=1186058 RepID=J8TY48_TRIAS|nr:tryptophan 2,3-dioxygenase [Trichosporon asahii var. asahii CBS 2479]EJT53022.1 tryptophan 2,3-dioxygenase [Trichosporon asahii var. asahii CBS 2479]